METFTKEQVLAVLRQMVEESSTAKVGAKLGVVPQLISLVLTGKREISEGLALRLGFVKLPDTYMRAPEAKSKKKK